MGGRSSARHPSFVDVFPNRRGHDPPTSAGAYGADEAALDVLVERAGLDGEEEGSFPSLQKLGFRERAWNAGGVVHGIT